MQRTVTITICDVCHEVIEYTPQEATDYLGRHVCVCEECENMDFFVKQLPEEVVILGCGQCATEERDYEPTTWPVGKGKPCGCPMRSQ